MERILVDEESHAVTGAVEIPVEAAGGVEHVTTHRVDIAGRGGADVGSFSAAIELAMQLARS